MMIRRAFIGMLGVLLLLAGGLVALRLRSTRGQPVPAAREVAASAPEEDSRAPRAGFIGVIVAEGAVDVAAKGEGLLEQVDVRVGDEVRQGAVLARLDTAELRRELAVAQASLQAAQAEAGVSRIALEETRERVKRRADPQQLALGVISEEELATARYQEQTADARLRVAEAQTQQRQAQVEQLQQRLSDAQVRAPFDGRVAMRYLDAGAQVTAGRPIVHLIRSGARQVRFAIPEDAVARVTAGLPVEVEVPRLARALRGRVENVSPEVDAAARMVLAVASLEEPREAPVPSGLEVRVRLVDSAPRAEARHP
ncbi:efflux RND transporter periplasmic adaptor subunit [Myxococcaceae bacterium GXIMD 01537]